MELLKNKNKRQSFIASVIFHALLMIVFVFYGLSMPDPLPEETSLSVQLDLGNTDMGSGDEQPQSTEEPEEVQPQEQEVVEEVTSTPEPIATQDEPSSYEVVKPVEKKVVEKPKEDPKPVLDEKLSNVISKKNLFQTTENNDSEGQGNSDQAGDFGKQDGVVGGNALSGDKNPGVKGNLTGRSFQGAPRIQSDLQESGKIVINIIVDRKGNVVRATPGGRGTTITNAALTARVLESARKAKFSPSENAATEQPGTLEYIFILE